jgi:transposase
MDAKRRLQPQTPALGWRNKARRKFSAEQRQSIVEECFVPGASVSEVGLRHGINNSQLFKWRRQYLAAKAALPKPAALIPVMIEAPPVPVEAPGSSPEVDLAGGSIEIELSGARIRLHGSVDRNR